MDEFNLENPQVLGASKNIKGAFDCKYGICMDRK